jgi:hypothetical protein
MLGTLVERQPAQPPHHLDTLCTLQAAYGRQSESGLYVIIYFTRMPVGAGLKWPQEVVF